MGSYWTQLGQQVAGQAAQGAIGIGVQRIGANYDRKQQLKTQEKMMSLQMRGMKEMSEFEQQQQLEMWKATGAPEQMKLLKEAGLNPALMYGGSGAGGQTVGHGGSSPGGGQASYVDTTGAGMNLAMNMKLQEAQIKLMESQAKKTDVEAEKTAGVDTEKTATETESLIQGIKNQKAQEALTRVNEKLAAINFNITEATQESVIQKVHSEMYKILQEAHVALNEAGISDATKQDKIKIIKSNAIGVVLDNALTSMQTELGKSEIAVNDATINKWTQELMIKWDELSNDNKRIMIQQMMADFETDPMTNAARSASKVIEEALDGILRGRPKEIIKTETKGSGQKRTRTYIK